MSLSKAGDYERIMTKRKPVFAIEDCYVILLAVTPFVFIRSFSDPSQTPVFLFLSFACLLCQIFLLLKKDNSETQLLQ